MDKLKLIEAILQDGCSGADVPFEVGDFCRIEEDNRAPK
jgi:hypothetical protein